VCVCVCVNMQMRQRARAREKRVRESTYSKYKAYPSPCRKWVAASKGITPAKAREVAEGVVGFGGSRAPACVVSSRIALVCSCVCARVRRLGFRV